MSLDIAMGGSTNTVSTTSSPRAHEAEVDFTMADIDRLSRRVPGLVQGRASRLRRAYGGQQYVLSQYIEITIVSRLGVILFGLIMVLTVTLTAGLTVAEGRAGVRQLLLAAIGCNLAWGIIDAVMYIMNCLTERSGKVRLIEAVQRARDNRKAVTPPK